MDAAALAAKHSQAGKKGVRVMVHACRASHVTKEKGAKAGQVKLMVSPKEVKVDLSKEASRLKRLEETRQ